MTKETYEAAVAALRASPFAAAGSVTELDRRADIADAPAVDDRPPGRVRGRDELRADDARGPPRGENTHGSPDGYRYAVLRVLVTSSAEAGAVAASFAALAMSIGDRAGVSLSMYGANRGIVEIAFCRPLAADEAARLPGPAETLCCADVPA